ncbi:Glycine-rich family protein, putative isoform 2 [Theobroma cacao]|uniref:Glycine-rich family protein, putative isoform 2 n=1 Tax=Theobroma cacao TaxID=3641 RepID=A0A061EPB0_THECC|nr:Glycine-rich family protein, putative isoform 2 [Theobroma cacao]
MRRLSSLASRSTTSLRNLTKDPKNTTISCQSQFKSNTPVPPPPSRGKADEGLPQTGGVARDPAQIVAKALLCFNDKYIYSSCEESCRLTASGNLGVPPGYIDEYCSGPCLSETHLVLNCIENIMTNFLFYNRATIQDIRDTIQAGCGYGPERGDFNVEEHIEAEGSSASKAATQILIGIGSMIIACTLLL